MGLALVGAVAGQPADPVNVLVPAGLAFKAGHGEPAAPRAAPEHRDRLMRIALDSAGAGESPQGELQLGIFAHVQLPGVVCVVAWSSISASTSALRYRR